MPYGSLLADVVKSSTSSPITFQNTSGTEIGTLCRAWVNFNGTGTVAIRASFNVSSITDNGTGDYTVNFTNAMPDTNYATSASCRTTGVLVISASRPNSTSAAGVLSSNAAGGGVDSTECSFAAFR